MIIKGCMKTKKKVYNFLLLVSLTIFVAVIFFASCSSDWEDYYQEPDYSSVRMFDIVKNNPDYSMFVNYLEDFSFDTLFDKNQSRTLFVPVNSAFKDVNLTDAQMNRVLAYHITNSVIIPSQVEDYKKIQTLFGKFSILERKSDKIFRDGKELQHNNPLYQDGTFFTIDELLYPRPNLYEFLQDTCPILSELIDEKDSILLDPIMSKPIGFDDEGNTIYDSVFNIVNTFERDYFPVSEEFRDNVATMVVCDKVQYENALDVMASNLGSQFVDHNDIPEDWQKDVFIPYIFDNGTFIGALSYEEFQFPLIQNILGDSIKVDYTKIDAESRFECSNGIVFLYNDFDVPSNLYIDTLIIQGEDLLIPAGSDFTWDEEVITSDVLIVPKMVNSVQASNEKYLSVTLPRGSSTSYYIEFVFPKVFPNTYKFLWRANYRPSGFIACYYNDELIGSFDNSYFRYPIDGNKPTSEGFNQKVWQNIVVDNYGDIRIKIEYQFPGAGTSNGINLDFVALIPQN